MIKLESKLYSLIKKLIVAIKKKTPHKICGWKKEDKFKEKTKRNT